MKIMIEVINIYHNYYNNCDSDKEILDGYHKDRDKGYQDGVDYVGETMTKKELTSALKSMRSEVVRRSEDGQRVMKR